jgi:hypothetical protein
MKSYTESSWRRARRVSRTVAVLALLAILGTGRVWAQSTGSFTATGNLTRPRMFHTATLLTNGKVLIAGGFSFSPSFPVWASAELYDPSTGSLTASADMTTSRYSHTATLLSNGKVLIAGGSSTVNGPGSLASAELYDPSTGSFIATGGMTTPRTGHTATLLNNGKVLIAGGYSYILGNNGAQRVLASAELYDPSTGSFTSATGDMTTGRSWPNFTATLLTNGKVLVAGESADLFDPDTGTFNLTGGTTYPDMSPETATLLANGKVLFTLTDSEFIGKGAEVYDPGTGSFTRTGNMTTGRGYSTATLLPDGKVLIAGRDPIHFASPTAGSILYGGSAELYDPVTGTFNATGDMLTQSAEGHTATLLPNGTVLLSGGWVCCGFSIASAEFYHPTVLVPAPVLFSVSGGGQGAILHAGTNQFASSSNPAIAGEALEIYCTGLIDGSVIPPQVAIGGRMAEILFFGNAPGFAGLNQVNVRVPSGVAPGPFVPVRLTYLGRTSNEVTIGVR